MPTRDKRVWMFNSGDTFAGNPKWLFVYVTKFRPDITAYWLCETEKTANYVRGLGYEALTFKDPRAAQLQRLTGVYVVNQVKEHIPKELRAAVFLNLWHGVGVKGIERAMNPGYLQERIAKKYIRHNQLYRNNQLFLCTSELMERHFREQIGLDDESVVRGGYPQNVFPREIGGYSTFDHDVVAARGLPPGTRVALYAPTPRRHQSPDFLHQAFGDISGLVTRLVETETLLIIKMHPHLSKDRYFAQLKESFGDCPNLLFWDNTLDIYEIFPRIDLAIVDYSSILYDLLAAGVQNVIRYVFDYSGRGTAVVAEGFDYFELSCGTVVESFDGLLEALGTSNRVEPARLDELNALFWSYSQQGSMEQLVERAMAHQIRAIALPQLHTFDVFDTVIHRRGVTPGSVHQYVKQRIETSSLQFPTFVVDRYPELRAQAEASERDRRNRQQKLVADGVLEVTFEEIHDRFQDTFDLTTQQSQALRDWEIEAELASATPDLARIEQVERLRADGATVALVSDMYLPREVIRSMLAQADPRLLEYPLFLSSDTREQKSTRSLYLKVYRDIGYDFSEWVHHGDSPWGDVAQAKALGITVDEVPATKHSGFESAMLGYLSTFDGHLYVGMLRDFRLEGGHTAEEKFAFNQVGPYLVPYVDWALRDAVRRGYRTLYFISRDGHHLKQIADVLIQERGLDLRTAYIYGSRTVWRIASQIDRLDPDLFEPHGDFFNVRTVQALLDAARIDRERFVAIFPQFAALTDEDLQRSDSREAVLATLADSPDFHADLLRSARAERELAVAYLRQEIDFDESFAFVEYWGSGYTQDCLARLIVEASERDLDTRVYYARAVRPSEGRSVRHRFSTAVQSMLFVEAIFANLPHSSTLSYRRTETGELVPVTKERTHAAHLQEAMDHYLPIQARRYAQLNLLDPDRLAHDVFRAGLAYYAENTQAAPFVDVLAPLLDAVGVGAAEQEFAPGMTRADLKRHIAGDSFRLRTRSMPMTLARSSEWVRVNYNLHTEPPGTTATWKKAALLGRAFVRTGYHRTRKRLR